VFESRVLRRIFGPKRDGVTGGWTKLQNEELHNLYYLPSKIRIIKTKRMRWAGHVGGMGGELIGKPKGQMESSCESGNEPSVSIKYWEIIECVHNLWHLVWCSAL
jgi:hypothetical protein